MTFGGNRSPTVSPDRVDHALRLARTRSNPNRMVQRCSSSARRRGRVEDPGGPWSWQQEAPSAMDGSVEVQAITRGHAMPECSVYATVPVSGPARRHQPDFPVCRKASSTTRCLISMSSSLSVVLQHWRQRAWCMRSRRPAIRTAMPCWKLFDATRSPVARSGVMRCLEGLEFPRSTWRGRSGYRDNWRALKIPNPKNT